MNGAETVHHGCGMNTGDAMRWEATLNNLQSALIVGVTENRNDYDRVANVKVGVARREARTAIPDVTGHWELQDFQTEAHKFVVVLFQYGIVLIGGIVFERAKHSVFADEARDVIDVAVCVVANDAFAEPEHGRNIKVFL